MITLERGALKQTVISNLQDVDTNTELKLYFALQRRHLAFDLVNLLSWSVCQKWLDKLMSTLVSDAPSNFSAITLTQVMRADREIFSILASEHKGSLKAAAGGRPPLEEPFERLMHDPRINVDLIAMPKVAAQQPPKRPLEPESNRPSPVRRNLSSARDRQTSRLSSCRTSLQVWPERQKQGSQCIGISTCPKAATTQSKAADVGLACMTV